MRPIRPSALSVHNKAFPVMRRGKFSNSVLDGAPEVVQGKGSAKPRHLVAHILGKELNQMNDLRRFQAHRIRDLLFQQFAAFPHGVLAGYIRHRCTERRFRAVPTPKKPSRDQRSGYIAATVHDLVTSETRGHRATYSGESLHQSSRNSGRSRARMILNMHMERGARQQWTNTLGKDTSRQIR